MIQMKIFKSTLGNQIFVTLYVYSGYVAACTLPTCEIAYYLTVNVIRMYIFIGLWK